MLCFRANNVQKIFKLEDSGRKSSEKLQFYMIFANVAMFARVLEQIKSQLDVETIIKGCSSGFNVVAVPFALCMFEDMLEQAGLAEVVKLHSFQWFPLCLDEGVLSLELPNMYRDIFVHRDLSLVSAYTKSLWQLRLVLGKSKVTFALGQHANNVAEHLEVISEANEFQESEFASVLLVDRNVDYPSALLTPTTYAALLSEVYNVNCGTCEHKHSDRQYDNVFNRLPQKSAVGFSLDSATDSIYGNIKNRSFAEVTTILHKLTKSFKAEVPNSREMALYEVKKYVATKLQADASRKKNLISHLAAAETIVNCLGQRFESQKEFERNAIQNKSKSKNYEYFDEVTAAENCKQLSLRVMCLMACTQKLSESEVKSFLTKFAHQFGYKFNFVYRNLVQAGFLNEQPGGGLSKMIPRLTSSNFYTNANKLKQVPSDPAKISMKSPTCCSYVFNGLYIPLVTQIASMILNGVPLSEVKAKLEPLGTFSVKNEKSYPTHSRSILVYVIGGITYAEIAACNLLESLTGGRIVVCSDKVVSGNDLMDGLVSLT